MTLSNAEVTFRFVGKVTQRSSGNSPNSLRTYRTAVHLKQDRSHSVTLPRGDSGNGKMPLKPFNGKAMIERRNNFENLFVNTFVTYRVFHDFRA
jgi:hypothetical protein